jgi:hypothetical protein
VFTGPLTFSQHFLSKYSLYVFQLLSCMESASPMCATCLFLLNYLLAETSYLIWQLSCFVFKTSWIQISARTQDIRTEASVIFLNPLRKGQYRTSSNITASDITTYYFSIHPSSSIAPLRTLTFSHRRDGKRKAKKKNTIQSILKCKHTNINRKNSVVCSYTIHCKHLTKETYYKFHHITKRTTIRLIFQLLCLLIYWSFH